MSNPAIFIQDHFSYVPGNTMQIENEAFMKNYLSLVHLRVCLFMIILCFAPELKKLYTMMHA